MFGQIGQIAGLLKNAGKLKELVGQVQARLAAARIEGEAGAGQVRATVDGRGELIQVRIEPALVQAGDVEMIEELVTSAVRDAVRRSRQVAQSEIESITGGLNIPGLKDMLGG